MKAILKLLLLGSLGASLGSLWGQCTKLVLNPTTGIFDCIGIPVSSSAITGSGSAGTITKFTSPSTIGNSVLTELGNVITANDTLNAAFYQVNGTALASTDLSDAASLATLTGIQALTGKTISSFLSGTVTVSGAANVLTATGTTSMTFDVTAGSAQSTTPLQQWKNNAGTAQATITSGGYALVSGLVSGGGTGKVDVGFYHVGITLASDTPLLFSPTTASNGVGDTSLSRIGPGIIGVGTGAAGSVAGIIQAAQHQALGAGAASVSPLLGSGAWFTGGSATTTKPYLLIEPAGTTSTAWSTAGTGIGVNAASGFVGNLLDLQVAGVTQFLVGPSGSFTAKGTAMLIGGGNGSADFAFGAGPNHLYGPSNGVVRFEQNGGGFGRLQFGGVTSAEPALKRSTTGLIARLADDSADTWFQSISVAGGGTPSVATCGTIGTGSKNNAGFITSGTTGACVSVVTFSGYIAATGWSCGITNGTTANIITQTGSSTTTATFTGTTVSGDVLRYACTAY